MSLSIPARADGGLHRRYRDCRLPRAPLAQNRERLRWNDGDPACAIWGSRVVVTLSAAAAALCPEDISIPAGDHVLYLKIVGSRGQADVGNGKSHSPGEKVKSCGVRIAKRLKVDEAFTHDGAAERLCGDRPLHSQRSIAIIDGIEGERTA